MDKSRLFEMGFATQLRAILSSMPESRQTYVTPRPFSHERIPMDT